jgi:ribosomal subunit interface protein
VIGEDFSVTDAMHAQIQDKVQKMIAHMKSPADFTVFLKKIGTFEFEVKFQTHYKDTDFVGQGKDKDFYTALNFAKKNLLRQLDDHHAKKVNARRHA